MNNPLIFFVISLHTFLAVLFGFPTFLQGLLEKDADAGLEQPWCRKAWLSPGPEKLADFVTIAFLWYAGKSLALETQTLE